MLRIQFTWQMGLSTLALAVFAVGCSSSTSEFALSRNSAVHEAQGELKVSDVENGNTEISVEVNHLMRASEVRSDAETYVVWAQAHDGGEVFNLGALDVGRNGKGEMESLTPLKKFDLYITAEPMASVKTPSGERTLWASVAQQ